MVEINEQKLDKMLELIRDYGMPVGATHLGKRLGMAQATVGRMLFMLEDRGLVRKESSKGRVITEKGLARLKYCAEQTDRQKSIDYVVHVYDKLSRQRLLEIMDVRLVLEAKTVQLACLNRSEEQISSLEKTLLEWELNLREGGYGSEQDCRLHLTIAEMSGNDTMYSICQLLLTRDDAYNQFSLRAENLKTTHTREHEAIVAAIRQRDPESGRLAMERHLLQVRRDIEHNFID